MQVDDYPIVIEIEVTTVKNARLESLPEVEKLINPVLEKAGYIKVNSDDGLGKYYSSLYRSDNKELPRHLLISTNGPRIENGTFSIRVHTKGVAENGTYTGHDDQVTFNICKAIKPILNPSR